VLRNGMRFQIISTGPTTVSDGAETYGVAAFAMGLEELGFKPQFAAGHPDHVAIEYMVPVGKFKGRSIKLGFVVPGDFPLTTPTGPHVSPLIHAQSSSSEHPLGGVHHDRSQPFATAFGGDWQYWSRPMQRWNEGPHTVDRYMAFIWRLWETQ
jgi:hypothetical protein